MIPLMIISVGVAFAFKMQIWNAGGEGQLHIGAAAATYVVLHLNGCSRFVTVLLAFLAAFICAGIYGLIPAILKVKWKVNELITCLMLNYVATFFVAWLIQGPWKDPTGFAFPRTRKIPSAGELTTFFGTRIHTGLIIGLAIALALWFVIYKTRWGFEIKLIGAKEKVARYAGMSVNRNILLVMFLSAGIAGIAGMVEICGITHRLQANRLVWHDHRVSGAVPSAGRRRGVVPVRRSACGRQYHPKARAAGLDGADDPRLHFDFCRSRRHVHQISHRP